MSTLNEKLNLIRDARDDIQIALAEKGQIVGKDIRYYAEAVANIEGGSEGVKLFETEAEMQADENPQEGDLAVVYRQEIQPVTEESEFDSCVFPNTVVLDEAFTDNIYGSFRSTGSSYFDGSVDMSSSRFRFNGYGESGNIRVQYGSQDGITYTRNDGGEELQEFGTTVKWENWGEPFNSVIGNFMKIGGNYFDGLYKYDSSYISTNDFGLLPISGIDIANSSYTGSPVGHYDVRKVSNILNNIKLDLGVTSYMQVAITTVDNNLSTIFFGNDTLEYVYADELGYNEANGYYQISHSWNYNGFIYVYTLDLVNETYNLAQKSPVKSGFDWIDINGELGSLFGIVNISEDGVANLLSKVTPYIRVNIGSTSSIGTISFPESGDISKNLFYNEPSYISTKTQLNATVDDVYIETFMGKNGVETGTLQNKEGLTVAQISKRVTIWNNFNKNIVCPSNMTGAFKDMSDLTAVPLLDTSNVTNMTSMFNGCVSLRTIPLLDTSNVTNMEYMFLSCTNLQTIPALDTKNVIDTHTMFQSCINLTTIPPLDTSKVKNMEYMFNNCRSLQTMQALDTSNVTTMVSMFNSCVSLQTLPLLNTSKVTSMRYTFTNCTSLQTIPLLDTSNVTDMYEMFFGCTSLQTLPLLDTSKVDYMYRMFENCTNLTTIPVFNTSSVISMSYMFTGCKNLTTTSLNNILAMCANGSHISTTNRTLKSLGLTQEQANTCKTLSNYTAFTKAGWTTGY